MIRSRFGRIALLAASAAAYTACASFVDDETAGTRQPPAAGAEFQTYVSIGTSITAGFQSGGINDSTQRQSFAAMLASAMGHTVGASWEYPGLALPGCPAPLINPLNGLRVNGASATFCGRRTAASVSPVVHNIGIPGLRAAHVLNVADLTFPLTDTLKLAAFITGGRNPIDAMDMAEPTFVTLEVGANDVLGAATRGDTTLLTPVAAFTTTFQNIAQRIADRGTNVRVAVAGVPNVTVIPFFTRAAVLFCLKTGACPGVPATPPFNSANFTVDNSCAPNVAGGVGDSYLLTFPATGTITNVLAAGGFANLNCALDQAQVNTGAGFVTAGPTLNINETPVVVARVNAFNTAIQAEVNSRGWAYVDLNAVLGANAASIPPIPSFSTPFALFGPLFSQDGVHPNAAGHRILAQAFAAAINTKYGSSLTVP